MTDFIHIHAEIAELSACFLTRKERADGLRRIEELLAALNRAREGEGG